MGSTVRKTARKYTYQDYRTWPEDESWEIIEGEASCMTPAPTTRHQGILGRLFSRIEHHLRQNPCRPFAAPTDVVLDNFNIVQPDILIVCDENKITEANIQGAPDLVVEILSPSTALKDRREKRVIYERFGVREYILVDAGAEIVERFFHTDGSYGSPDIFNWDEIFISKVFPDMAVNLWEIFDRQLTQTEETIALHKSTEQ
jgi:Uma2 family endonuclease